MGEFLDLFARLDADPIIRGKQFERVCEWFLTNDPAYCSTLRQVWLCDEWSGRWAGDAGIDLVAVDYEDRLWAIQCKAYAAANWVTLSDVDKFLSESSRAVFLPIADRHHRQSPPWRSAHHQPSGEAGRLRRVERLADL